ncbi:carbohydrate ABC transporter substrate-binding protein [Yangia mangrovi]|uniref:Probable sugar-binding periplasmic protein n=1 Tax=Alloyangia mangrovi TaxID=1779329 RepID=A0A2A3K0B5_9RHOB|nr:ABC transporter substrate-binding protein [Alloyangia mangrovi]MCT4371586.1 carbohydrate ABC transporter substrate-binding protein [Alloyangia mangrovi]
MKLKSALFASVLALPVPAMAQDKGTIEVLHHWVSESEVAALNVVREKLAAEGFGWEDSAVGGMSGANATQALRTRLASGNPPGAMQFLGYEGQNWFAEGVVRDFADVATAEGWFDAIAPQVRDFVTKDGAFFAMPINMHRQNWVWANKKVFDEHGLTVPGTWDELIAMGPVLKEAGIVPLATGDEAWQIQLIFDALVADLHGPDFYRRSVVELDPEALSGPEMIDVFDTLRQVRGLVDDGFVGRDWAVATGMVASGEAAMQVHGDWAKGEFLAQGLTEGEDFLCFATPSETPSFLFLIDSFGAFKTSDAATTAAQDALAMATMDPQVQREFNMIKGSIPARSDVSVDGFDACAIKGFEDRAAAVESGAMLGALTHGFASQPQFAGVFGDVVGQFFVTDMTSQQAVEMLASGIANAM